MSSRRGRCGCPRGRSGCRRAGRRRRSQLHHSPTRRVRTWPPPNSSDSARCARVRAPVPGRLQPRPQRRPAPAGRPRLGADRRKARRIVASAGPPRRPSSPAVCSTKSNASPLRRSSSRRSAGRLWRERLSARWSTNGSPSKVFLQTCQGGAHAVAHRALEPVGSNRHRHGPRLRCSGGQPVGRQHGHLLESPGLGRFERVLEEWPVGHGKQGRGGQVRLGRGNRCRRVEWAGRLGENHPLVGFTTE